MDYRKSPKIFLMQKLTKATLLMLLTCATITRFFSQIHFKPFKLFSGRIGANVLPKKCHTCNFLTNFWIMIFRIQLNVTIWYLRSFQWRLRWCYKRWNIHTTKVYEESFSKTTITSSNTIILSNNNGLVSIWYGTL